MEEIKAATALPEFGKLPALVEEKPEPKREVAAIKTGYGFVGHVLRIALLGAIIAGAAAFWHYRVQPQLDAFAADCATGEAKQ